MPPIAEVCTALTCAFSVETWHEVATQYPPCTTEHVVDCVWDGRVLGGASFIAIDMGDAVRIVFEPVDGEMQFLTYPK